MDTAKAFVYFILGALAAAVVGVYLYNTRPPEPTVFVPPTVTPVTALIDVMSTPPPFERYHIGVVVAHFQDSELEFANVSAIPADDTSPLPKTYTAAMHFAIPSLCPDCGGHVFTFASNEDLQIVHDYYAGMGNAWSALDSHLFTRANILLQINGDLPNEKAEQYRQALYSLP